MIDSRKSRRLLSIAIAGAIASVVVDAIINPTVKKAVR